VDCDYCIDEHLTHREQYSDKMAQTASLQRSQNASNRLTPLCYDPQLRDHLNTYRDTHPKQPILREDTRKSTEPPMPGYRGFIARVNTTEHGLGARYHETTARGLRDFYMKKMQNNMSASRAPDINANTIPAITNSGARLYKVDGMIPKYTGYMPQNRFRFGNTYGDQTRSLEVCSHDKTHFGELMRTKPREPIISSIC
jgi:hypothetical protein